MENLVIRNGLVVTPQGVIRGGLAVRGERILQISADDLLPKGDLEVDAGGCYVLPGLIDPHVHFGGREEKEFVSQLRSESIGAAISGITTWMGYIGLGTLPEPRALVYQRVKEFGEQNSSIDFKIHAYLMTNTQLDELPDVIREGITSAKLLLGYKEQEAKRIGIRAVGLDFAYKAMELLATYGPPVLIQVHCEQPDIIAVIGQQLEARGRTDFLAWVESRPSICEAIHAFTLGLMSFDTGCPLYIVHISAKETVDIIKYLRQKGVKIYAETCPHYLTLTKQTHMGILAKMAPPLRDDADTQYLWQALSDGTINTIGSDHCLRTRRDKEEGGAWGGIPGVGGIGAILPLMMTEGVNKGKITIEQLVKLTSENAARIWGIYPRKGTLSPGADADIVIVDPNLEWVLSAENLRSASDYSIYEGRRVKGKAVKTFLRGNLIAADGDLVAKTPLGKYVYPL